MKTRPFSSLTVNPDITPMGVYYAMIGSHTACYRAETQLYEAVGYHAAFARNPDEGRAVLQRVFQQPADIIPNYDENQLEVRFHTMSIRPPPVFPFQCPTHRFHAKLF